MRNNKFNLLTFSLLFVVIILSFGLVSAVSAVNLGTAGDFVVLSKSGISTTGTTSIVGDLGVSPIDSTAITGFGLIMDISNQWSTSSLVTGKIYASDYFVTTPATLTTAVSDMEIAYTDAAGRTNPTATELGAGDISGMTITPGLYKWGTGLRVDSSGVTLSGEANDVWIFQIGEDLTISNGAIITLSGGAQAKNIFWQVIGQTTLGTTSNFKGNILCATAIVFNTGATLNGRALSQTAVTLDANTIVSPETNSPLIVTSTSISLTSTTSENGNSAGTSNSMNLGIGSENVTSNAKTNKTVMRNSETIRITFMNDKVKLSSGEIKVETELPIEVEGNNIRATQSNGVQSEIKIMPDAASEIALNRLRLRVCSEENNCTIELKEVGKKEQAQIVYELKIQKESKILGLFKKQMKVSVQVNAKTGEIVGTEKPWWAFLASEKDEREGRN
ncbi:hypothetical protein COU58_03045 [Candidatus Pacearchaeota archaeon CG10_big_fil_rev_8_21_14_0_10_32_42]|nr:MAG: hypothetical protein COU58_03045 [Candidatus Pacearchaeota archaeon CG10_big_fil_rev_8_21_14_0_10_32_42]